MAGGYGRLETRHDLRDVVAVELLDRGVERGALLALDEELGDLGAAREVLGLDLAHSALLRGRLSLGVQRAERVLGELALVLLERGLGLGVPDLALLRGQVLPREADDLAQRAVVRFDLGRDVLVLDERRAEEDERVWRARDVVLGPLLGVRGAARACGACRRTLFAVCGEEERRVCSGHERLIRARRVVERARGDGRGERDALRSGEVGCGHNALGADVCADGGGDGGIISHRLARGRSTCVWACALCIPLGAAVRFEARTRSAGMTDWQKAKTTGSGKGPREGGAAGADREG